MTTATLRFRRTKALRFTLGIRPMSGTICSGLGGRSGLPDRSPVSVVRAANWQACTFILLWPRPCARRAATWRFVTAAEWLDVNYGSLLRRLFLSSLGGQKMIVVEPTVMPFPDATTTTVISCFEIGRRVEMVQVKRVTSLEQLGRPNGHRLIPRERMEREARWSRLVRPERKTHAGYIELGELCRVHRGQVTGANKVWVEGPYSRGLPAQVFFPAVTKAREFIRSGRCSR